MGVGQSHELLGKVPNDRVFVCTNQDELFSTLKGLRAVLQIKPPSPLSPEGSALVQHPVSGGFSPDREVSDTLPSTSANTIEAAALEENVKPHGSTTTDKGVTMEPIEEVHIANHYMGDDGFISGHQEVLQTLASSSALRLLDIGYNALTSASLDALFGYNSDGSASEGSISPSGFLPPNLHSLNFAGNRAGRAGCERLAKFLSTDPPLRVLSLYNNDLYDEDVEPLLYSLRMNTNLRQLNLDFNNLTGGFLRQLLELLGMNRDLSVVLYDGPYDMGTFERLRELRPVEAIPNKDEAKAAHARAVLRCKLLHCDLAGRPPFPVDLVREVDAIMEPRRKLYLEELKAERLALQQEEMAMKEELERARRCCDVGCEAPSDEEDEEQDGAELDGAAEEQQSNTGGSEDNDAKSNITGTSGVMGGIKNSGLASIGRRSPTSGSFPQSGSIPIMATTRSRLMTDADTSFNRGTSTSLFTELAPLTLTTSTVIKKKDPSASAALMRRSSAFFAATRLSRESIRSAAKTKGSVSTGKELRNGFDRLILAPVSESGKSQTVWKAVAGRPCRLRACWCDARVDIVPYANVLHYHCKYEQLTNDLGYEMEPSRKFITRGSRPSGRHDSRVSVKSSDRRKAMTPWQGSSNTGYPGNRTTYQGCKGTSHQCESIGFYGKPRPDKRSVVFFSDQHPMLARGLRE